MFELTPLTLAGLLPHLDWLASLPRQNAKAIIHKVMDLMSCAKRHRWYLIIAVNE